MEQAWEFDKNFWRQSSLFYCSHMAANVTLNFPWKLWQSHEKYFVHDLTDVWMHAKSELDWINNYIICSFT